MTFAIPVNRIGRSLAGLALLALMAVGLLALPGEAPAAKRCFGKPAKSLNRPGTYRLAGSKAVIINAPVRIVARGEVRICTGKGGHPAKITLTKASRNLLKLGSGNDVVRVTGPSRLTQIDAGDGNNRIILAGKATKQVVTTGDGNDSIQVKPSAKASSRTLSTGLGKDRVVIQAKGNTTATLSPQSNPRGLPNSANYSGGPSNDIVATYGGTNVIHGNNGADVIRSLGNAESTIYGDNGSDRIFSNGKDTIYGGRGNDKIDGRAGSPIGGIYADGGAGDDWLWGTDANDILVGATGIDKFWGNGGNDLFRLTEGNNTVEGGGGTNTVSFSSHIPPGWSGRSGVLVDLRQGIARGSGATNRLSGITNVIGSSFDDVIRTHPSRPSEVWGGLGDDEIDARTKDTVHSPFRQKCNINPRNQVYCPPPPDNSRSVVMALSPDGVLTVIGSRLGDSITIASAGAGSYRIRSSQPFASPPEGCEANGGLATCHVPNLATVLAYTGAGDDTVVIDDSLPASLTSVIDGGDGNNVIRGGRGSDYLFAGRGNSQLDGGAGDDVITTSEGSTRAAGGPGHDVFRISNPCAGHTISGGPGKDNAVFALSPRAVEVNFQQRLARWRDAGSCNPTTINDDVEGGEGSRFDDLFVGSTRRSSGFLGRDGRDTFMVKNGRRDTVTVGGGGRSNKVVADRFDKVIWGWGFADY